MVSYRWYDDMATEEGQSLWSRRARGGEQSVVVVVVHHPSSTAVREVWGDSQKVVP